MAGLPIFPLPGTTISTNVDVARLSIDVNNISNPDWALGQYVFFQKASSIWFKYKNTSTIWTNEKLYLTNVRQSDTKFDKNGYPMTAYVDNVDNKVKMVYYPDGIQTTVVLASGGSFPTVVIDENDSYVVWVPNNFNNFLMYAQLCTNWLLASPYSLTLPGSIKMMSIQVVSDNRWLFTFECETTPENKIYIAFTNPTYKFATGNFEMFVTFLKSTMIDEYFVVAEYSQQELFELGVYSNKYNENLDILQVGVTGVLTLISSESVNPSEYFVVAEKSDLMLIADLLTSITLPNESFSISDKIRPTFDLTYIPDVGFNFNEYFVVAEDKDVFSIVSATTPSQFINETINIKEYSLSYENTFVGLDKANLLELLEITQIDKDTKFVLGLPPTTVVKYENFNEYFAIQEHFATDSLVQTIFIDQANLGPEKFYILDGKFPTFSEIELFIHSLNSKESFSITDNSNLLTFTLNILYIVNENFAVKDNNEATYDFKVSSLSAKFLEKLQIPDILSIITSTESNISQKLNENFAVGITNESYNLESISNLNKKIHENNLYIGEGTQSNSSESNISIKILQNIAPYVYNYVYNITEELSASVFTAENSVVPAFYYFATTSEKSLSGPKSYNIAIKSPNITFELTKIT